MQHMIITIIILIGLEKVMALITGSMILPSKIWVIILFSSSSASALGVGGFEKISFTLFCVFSLSLTCFYKMFSKKLMALMALELLMISTLFLFCFINRCSFDVFLLCVILSVILVCDSVFGVSLLISFSRCSSNLPMILMV